MNPPGRVIVADREITVISVPEGTTADSLSRLLTTGGIDSPVPTVVVVGGADGLDPIDAVRCERLIAEVLIPVLAVTGATIIDGGTDAGITGLVGRARRYAGAIGQHVGVVACGTVAWPDQPHAHAAAPLEPNQSKALEIARSPLVSILPDEPSTLIHAIGSALRV